MASGNYQVFGADHPQNRYAAAIKFKGVIKMISTYKLIQFFAISICLIIVSITNIQAEEEKPNQAAYPFMPYMPGMQSMPSAENMTYAMQKMMDPNTMMLLMNYMMNPKDVTAEAMCSACHTGEDIARYQKLYGPMLDAMWQPFQAAMNPTTYMGMMGMTDPMMGMMNPMMGMMNPMMGMMNPMMGMMNPMMGMMNPMMMGMMNPMMMNPMMGSYGNPMGQMPGGQMMDPKQYEEWFKQWTEMMQSFAPQAQSQQ